MWPHIIIAAQDLAGLRREGVLNVSGRVSIVVRTMGRPELTRALASLAASDQEGTQVDSIAAMIKADVAQSPAFPALRSV